MSYLLDLIRQLNPATHSDVMHAVITGEGLRGVLCAQEKDHPALRAYDAALLKWGELVEITLEEIKEYMLDVVAEAHSHEAEEHSLASVMHPLSELHELTRILAAGVRGGWWDESSAEEVAARVNERVVSLIPRKDATSFADELCMTYHDPDYEIQLYGWVHTLAWCSPEIDKLRDALRSVSIVSPKPSRI